MADIKNVSSLKRARAIVEVWFELLPKDARLDAQIALDKLCQLAEREIESAYGDGMAYSYDARRMSKYQDASQD